MTQRPRKHAVKVVEAETEESRTSQREAASRSIELDSPLYGVAMLKVAMELKKPNPRALDDILAGVLAKMGIDEVAFRRYLTNNGGLLRAIAQRKRY